MKECKECGGTGEVLNGRYCKCVDGKLLKAKMLGQARAVAGEKKASNENEIAAKKIEKLQEENKRVRRIPLLVGDWVDFSGKPAIVTSIDGFRNSFRVETNNPYMAAWITYTDQTPLPLERFDDPATLRQLVDMALMFKDRDWFNELAGGKKE